MNAANQYKNFYKNQYICGSNDNAERLFNAVQEFYNDLYIGHLSHVQYTISSGGRSSIFSNFDSGRIGAFISSDKDLLAQFYRIPNSLIGNIDIKQSISSQFKRLLNNYKDSTKKFYYHFVQDSVVDPSGYGSQWCKYNPSRYSYSQNYTWEGRAVYEIFLCLKVLTDINSNTLSVLPKPEFIKIQQSLYQIIAKEVAYLLDLSNYRVYAEKNNFPVYSLNNCSKAASTCKPLEEQVILVDCFSQIVHQILNLVISCNHL